MGSKKNCNKGLSPEDREIVLKLLKARNHHAPSIMTNEQAIQHAAETASRKVALAVNQLYKAGQAAPSEAQLGKLIMELFREEFKTWSKGDLLYLLVCLQTNIVMSELGYH